MVDLIRNLCKEKGISIMRLEKECGCANGTINKWDNKRPSADKLKAVADYFGVSMEFLLTGKEKQPSPQEGLSETAMLIAKLVDHLPEESRQLLLVQARALAAQIPDPGADV